ncbi:DALR anticodon-binding domain-containing protein [Sphingomonas sp. RS6]
MSLHARLIARLTAAIEPLAPAGWCAERVTLSPVRGERNGDLAINAAMLLAAAGAGESMAIAAAIADAMRMSPDIAAATIATPGFVNVRIADAALLSELSVIAAAGNRYGARESIGHLQPTVTTAAPHDFRSAAVAASIARMIDFAGAPTAPAAADGVMAVPAAGPVELKLRDAPIGLDDALALAGADLLRHAMLMDAAARPISIDMARLLDLSARNRVLAVHYVSARIARNDRHAQECGLGDASPEDLSLLDTDEHAVVRSAAWFPAILDQAALHAAPERIAGFISDLSIGYLAVHDRCFLEPAGRIVDPEQPARTRARLSLGRAIGQIISNGLTLIGVEAAEEM